MDLSLSGGWSFLKWLLLECDVTSMGCTFPDLGKYTAEGYLGGGRHVSVYDVGNRQVCPVALAVTICLSGEVSVMYTSRSNDQD